MRKLTKGQCSALIEAGEYFLERESIDPTLEAALEKLREELDLRSLHQRNRNARRHVDDARVSR